MTAGIEEDPEGAARAMAASTAVSTTTTACLNDDEWQRATPMMETKTQDRGGLQCLMEALGGPGKLAEAMTAAQEGDLTALAKAGAECRLNTGPTSWQTPAPTATAKSPTPVSTPWTTEPTPTATATTVPSTPTPTPATTLVITVSEIPANIPEYDGGEWKHWNDEDGDCQVARQEVMIERPRWMQ